MGRYQEQMAAIGDSKGAVIKDAAATLRLDEQFVRCDSTDAAFAVTLPPVAEAMGLMFAINFIVDGGDITIQDQNESYGWTDLVMTAVADHVCVYSDGLCWHVLHDTTT